MRVLAPCEERRRPLWRRSLCKLQCEEKATVEKIAMEGKSIEEKGHEPLRATGVCEIRASGTLNHFLQTVA